MPLLKPISPTRLYVQIARQIADAVQNETFKVGDKLPPERALAEELNVSRASVREALSALEILGIVESRSGNGTFIRRPPTEWTYLGTIFEDFVAHEDSPHEVLDARRILEPAVAQLAAERATDEQISQLELCLQAIEQAPATGQAPNRSGHELPPCHRHRNGQQRTRAPSTIVVGDDAEPLVSIAQSTYGPRHCIGRKIFSRSSAHLSSDPATRSSHGGSRHDPAHQ